MLEQQNTSVPTGMPQQSLPQQTPEPRLSSLRRIVLVGGIILLIILLIGGGYWYWRSRDALSPSVEQVPSQEGATTTDLGRVEIDKEAELRFLHDQDRDGITDEEEKKLGTSDKEFDTDGDGLTDVDETTVWKTDPTKVDTDNDGYGDGFEVLSGYSPTGAGKL